ncbi:MAG: hypothetical protein IJ097_03215 [Bacilli bacterium]|nr:hypothetical protein [Bacilli bacterium]
MEENKETVQIEKNNEEVVIEENKKKSKEPMAPIVLAIIGFVCCYGGFILQGVVDLFENVNPLLKIIVTFTRVINFIAIILPLVGLIIALVSKNKGKLRNMGIIINILFYVLLPIVVPLAIAIISVILGK